MSNTVWGLTKLAKLTETLEIGFKTSYMRMIFLWDIDSCGLMEAD
jgi:hypothetical protein